MCLILNYYAKKGMKTLVLDNAKLYVLDNFSRVKICQVVENQIYKKSFWTTR